MIKILLVACLYCFGSIYSTLTWNRISPLPKKNFMIGDLKFLKIQTDYHVLNGEVLVADSQKNLFKLDKVTKTNFLQYYNILMKLDDIFSTTYGATLQAHLEHANLLVRFKPPAADKIIDIGVTIDDLLLLGKKHWSIC